MHPIYKILIFLGSIITLTILLSLFKNWADRPTKQKLIEILSENKEKVDEKFKKLDLITKQKEDAHKNGNNEEFQRLYLEWDKLMKEIETDEIIFKNYFEQKLKEYKKSIGDTGTPNWDEF